MERHDVVVIGGGLTGMAAARRAHQLGLRVLVAAATPGSLPYTSGAMDLLAVYPTESRHYRASPWEALSELVECDPEHPYGKVGLGGVRSAWDDFAAHLTAGPLGYHCQPANNVLLVTSAGTLKPTHLVPHSMKHNVRAWESRESTLVLGFERLVDFSPEHVVQTLRERWPGLRAARIDATVLLEDSRRIRCTELAAAFERDAFRQRFADRVRPMLGGARFLGLPAVLGFEGVRQVCDELERLLGIPVFEIPMLSPSLPGMRLTELLKADLLRQGVSLLQGRPVRLEREAHRVQAVVWQGSAGERRFEAHDVILATGRFFGRGLVAHQGGVREPLLGLELELPSSRAHGRAPLPAPEWLPDSARDVWHMQSFLGAPGHPINRVGLTTDAELRPLDRQGVPVCTNLRAAGAILGGHDWVREKSGAGISVVTGYAAAERVAAAREVHQ